MNKHIIILCFIVFITLFSAVSYGSDYTPVITNYPDFKNISCLAANGDDIWIGTKYSGSYQFNRQTESFVHHEPGGSKIVVDGNGDVWIGINTVSSYKDGIWERHMDSSGFYTVSGLAVDSKGTIWRIYSYTRLEGETSIEYYNGHEWIVKYREYQGIHNRFINLAIDSKDRFWNLYYVWDDDANIPVYKIIGLYENEEIKLMDPGIYGHVTSIIEDNKGAMWFSTNVIVIDKSETEKPIMENNGIWVFDGETWINYTTENSGLISNHINVMVVDKYDRKWFGTDTGLVVYDGRNWITYSTADGLVDNTITALTIDDDDNLWVGTANGLLKISNSTGQVLRLMSPIAGDQVPSGGIFTITWKPAEVEKIKLEYSANGGIHWKNIADNVDVSTESYIWSVPDIISSECQIRISDTDNSQIYDINSDFFSIVFPEITIITPHGGEQWKTNFLCTIEWNYTASDKVNLEYSVDNGINWRPIVSNIDAVDRTYDWIIPEMEYSSTQCFVRVSDMVNPEIYKVNDRLFSIMSIKSNALSFENSGYNYINTLYYPVKSLELWIQFSGSPSDWLIKTTSYYDDTDYYSPSIISNIYVYEGISNEDFTLIKDKWYHVALTGFENKRHIYVNGDLVFEGSLSKNGIPSFNLSIGEKFKGIISELRIWASFINKDQIHENMYKRVDHGEGLTSAFHMTGGNRENIFFDSVGKKHGLLSGNYKWVESDVPLDRFHLLSPKTGDNWIAQSPHTIRWEDEGFFETVNIEFSSDSGTTWSTIAENIDAAAGSYEWTPEKASDECLLRIVNAENSGVLDATDEPFTIYGPTESIETKPLEFSVSQNSPNPFNPSTTISYIIPEPEQVTLEIYNVAGQKVITLVDSFMDSGQHEIVWDASDYSSGLYICRVSAGQFSGFKKMLLMK